MTYDKALIALNAGWNSRSDTKEGHFNFCVPLSMLSFCEDYKRLIVNARHKLILIRACNDYNCLVGNPATESEIELFKVQWRMPHVALNEVNKLCCEYGKQSFSEHEFSLVGSVRVSSVTEYDQAFMNYHGDSVGKTTIRYFCSADRLKEYHITRC